MRLCAIPSKHDPPWERKNKMRSVSADFVLAMEEKLQHGREQGRTGWDTHWEKTSIDDFGPDQLVAKLHEEVDEVIVALYHGTDAELRLECADVANIVMMLVDMLGVLDDE